MKIKQILDLYKTLQTLNLKGTKFNYTVIKNINLITPEINTIQKLLEITPAYKMFEEKRIELAEKHSEKDEKGRPIIENNSYKLVDKEKFEEELEILKETHTEALKERQEQFDNVEKLSEEESDVKLFKVNLSDIPAEITTKQMGAIYEIIEE